MDYIAGYPVNITSLANNDMLFFNGQEWVNIQPNSSPTVYTLATPTITTRQLAVFNEIPVLITNLKPSQVLYLTKKTFNVTFETRESLSVQKSDDIFFWCWFNGDYISNEEFGMATVTKSVDVINPMDMSPNQTEENSYTTSVTTI
jgi:hypothetical protein